MSPKMSNQFSEDSLVEASVVELISEIWGEGANHINAYTPDEDAKLGRAHQGEVLLMDRLLASLRKINPNRSEDSLRGAIDALSRERLETSLVSINQEIYKLLRDGYQSTETNSQGEPSVETVNYFDFENVENNDFLSVSQLWIVGELYTRRPDVIVYVNGIPLLVFELKASHVKLVNAYSENIRDYKDTIPKLFWYNLGIVISNGIVSKFGSLSAPYEFFNEWKKASAESEELSTSLRTLIAGICSKAQLLDIYENFVLFDTSGEKTKKILPRYFQFLGVNKAFAQVLDRNNLKGKLGVFWHTQGSGKSFSMVFLSQKVLRKILGNFTFVVVTDRKDLDRQAYKNFASVGAVYETEVHAESISHLKELLISDHRQIFTTIHKFQDISDVISTRNDIIVITDEAHRSQYDSYALNMRVALPNASFIGFTGTPLMAEGEEKTRETFGDYISEYNFADSVKDGATVPLYYENRIPKLKNTNVNLDEEISKIMDFYDLNDQDEETLEQQFSTFYQLVTRDERLDVVAEDIVNHFFDKGDEGKAMVVSIDKKTSIRTYFKVKKYWNMKLDSLKNEMALEKDVFKRDKIEAKYKKLADLDMAVMVSQSQNEISDLEKYSIDVRPIRQRIVNEDLETEFKDAESKLKIVFVCAMWMTGFDVPNLTTLYLDKPMKNHTLMQAIARANRVYPDKTNGLIVDYIGVFRNLERALAIYATNKGKSPIIESIDVLVEKFHEARSNIVKMFESLKINIDALIKANPEQKLIVIEEITNRILVTESNKAEFIEFANSYLAKYKAVLPDPRIYEFSEEMNAIKVLSTRIKAIQGGDVDLTDVKNDLEALLDRSIKASEFKIPAYVKLKDLSTLDAEKLKEMFAKNSNKIVQAKELASELEEKIADLIKKNKSRDSFLLRLTKVLDDYNNGSISIDDLLQNLVDLAHDLSFEEQRALRENLSEYELAIFDIIRKEELSVTDLEKVKIASRELLESLREKLVPGWREFDPLRSGVKITINNVIYPKLPENSYTEQDCKVLSNEVYRYVYERYPDASYLIAI